MATPLGLRFYNIPKMTTIKKSEMTAPLALRFYNIPKMTTNTKSEMAAPPGPKVL